MILMFNYSLNVQLLKWFHPMPCRFKLASIVIRAYLKRDLIITSILNHGLKVKLFGTVLYNAVLIEA